MGRRCREPGPDEGDVTFLLLFIPMPFGGPSPANILGVLRALGNGIWVRSRADLF